MSDTRSSAAQQNETGNVKGPGWLTQLTRRISRKNARHQQNGSACDNENASRKSASKPQ